MIGYPKPTVYKIEDCWLVSITRGFSGNYENDLQSFTCWRDAFDWAYDEVKDWDPSLRQENRARYT